MYLIELSKLLGIKQASVSQHGKELERAGHVFGKGSNGMNSYTEVELQMIKRMRELMQQGIKRSDAAVKVVKEWEGSEEPTVHKEEKTDENNDFHQEILNELQEIKKILNEMHINQQQKGFINLTFCKKTKK